MIEQSSRILTLDETAAYLKLHRSTVYRLLRRRSIPAFKIGSDWRFREQDLELWIAKLSSGNIKATT